MFEIKVKELFFDRALVIAAMDDATRRSLSKAGAFIMRKARTSMRYKTKGGETPTGRKRQPYKPSPPGSPPFAIRNGPRGPLLRDKLFFSWDPATRSVVVGPVGLGKATTPGLHEFGGSRVVRLRRRGQRQLVRQVYPARPTMAPALQANIDEIPEAFRDSLRVMGGV